MPVTVVSAMTLGNNFYFIPYFRGVLATNVARHPSQFGFGLLALCQKPKLKKPQPTTTQKMKGVLFAFFSVLLGLTENTRVFPI